MLRGAEMSASVDYSVRSAGSKTTLPRTASDQWTLLWVQMPELINILCLIVSTTEVFKLINIQCLRTYKLTSLKENKYCHFLALKAFALEKGEGARGFPPLSFFSSF